MATFPAKKARAEVELAAFDRLERRLRDHGVVAAMEQFQEEAQRQIEWARRHWGVRTGQTRASLMETAEARGTAFAVRVFSNHPTIKFQYFGKDALPTNRPPRGRPKFWTILVVRPLRKNAKKLAKAAAAKLAREGNRG